MPNILFKLIGFTMSVVSATTFAAAQEDSDRHPSIGVIVSGAAIDVSTVRSGKIAFVPVKPGQRVAANELLFSLQREDVDSAIAISEAALEQAKAVETEARTALERAQSDVARQMRAPTLFTNAQREAARFQVQTRMAQARAASASVAELSARALQSRLALSEVVVRATSAGTVAAVLRNQGEMANPGDTVMRLETASTPRVRFAASTDQVRELRLNDVVQVMDMRGQIALAQVLIIAPDIDAPTGMVIAEAQLFPVLKENGAAQLEWQCRHKAAIVAQQSAQTTSTHACGWQTGTAVEVMPMQTAGVGAKP